ncbi:MAG: DNA polymerase IV [Clostridia bacterium]
MERRILHADFNSFYASVACCLNPSLRAYPVAVAGNPEVRHGIILAKNELAKRFGVKTGEAIWQAKQKCPRLISVAPDFSAYERFSARGREVYGQYSDQVESFGLDENWIDVTGITSSFRQTALLADEIRVRIQKELGITISVGVAANKVFSKLGSDIKKPNAVTVVSPDNYQQVAWPLPASDLLYVGRVTTQRLNRYGIMTIGDVANTPPIFLKSQFGKCGLMLHAFANGQDISPVLRMEDETMVKSVGNGLTTPRDLVNNDDVYLTIYMLAESVAARLRTLNMRARTISTAVRDTGLYSFSRQMRLSKPTHITQEIACTAMELFRQHYIWRVPVRSLTVTACDLIGEETPLQLSLFGDEANRAKAEALDKAVDGIRKRYGYDAIGRALLMKDRSIGGVNPQDDHIIHPVGYLANNTMDEVINPAARAYFE